MEWIIVKDRLPEDKSIVLGLGPYEPHIVVVYESTDNHFVSHQSEWCCSNVGTIEDITHWMPIPKVPQ